ncbi:MAG: SEC-C domain-containing protein, partial [Fusobacterium periodonticum]|nr:SEC-C domain-containing protein [Fusobacterium periodonticum]
LTHFLHQALKAKELFKRDRDYLVRDNGEVVIIDEFTGRAMEGRRYSDGLHQAIEAKEGVKIASENQTLATITLQNYFRMYKKLSGMTGTAETEATEFMHTYGLEVVVIPTNLPVIRKDNADLVYKTKKEKINAIIDRIQGLYEKGQPVLVGTISIKSSEELSELLKKRGIPHNVLNAKYHAQEAEIVAQAGRYKAVTIATNMAGRGTDIMLGGNPEFMALAEVGSREDERFPETLAKYQEQCKEEKEKVLALGGLFILGTERHESRRIDNQLRGRSGRQGDPGESEFYLSLEDDLMRLFGSERVMVWMDRLKLPEGEPITHGMINSAIEKAQKKIEARNFGIRKNLLEFDDVMNKQRTTIYANRNQVLEIDNLKDTIMGMLHRNITEKVYEKFAPEMREDWDIDGLNEYLKDFYVYEEADDKAYLRSTKEEYAERIYNALVEQYNNKEAELGSDLMRKLEKHILFDVVDNRWRGHLKSLDALRESIYLRAYGQRDPVTEYKIISSQIFEEMISHIKEQTTSFLFKVAVKTEEERQSVEEFEEEDVKKVNSEESCPCGSGKPYEKCCGR